MPVMLRLLQSGGERSLKKRNDLLVGGACGRRVLIAAGPNWDARR